MNKSIESKGKRKTVIKKDSDFINPSEELSHALFWITFNDSECRKRFEKIERDISRLESSVCCLLNIISKMNNINNKRVS